jgi:Xaa-Pro dipeptidase
MLATRRARLQSNLRERGIAALALLPGPSFFYLTGVSFHLFERPIIGLFPADGRPALILPELERAKAETIEPPLVLFSYGEDPDEQPAALAEALRSTGMTESVIGVEPLRMRFSEQQLLRAAAPKLQLTSADEITVLLRSLKDPAEVDLMRRAVEIAESALAATLPLVEIGMAEHELAAELVVQLLRHGSDPELPFQPIVASGPNSALPHATAGQRKLAAGDALLIDWGASHKGYLSDLTRTFAVAEATPELAEMHKVVLAANRAGRAAVVPDQTCGAVDSAARTEIESAGYGPLFIHRTGHGLGLEEHEAPYIRGGNHRVLRPGMTFTVEPGVYQPGFGGVRIEDDVVVTESGGESLSGSERELRVVG